LYAKLGLQEEDENESEARKEACAKRGRGVGVNELDDELAYWDNLVVEMAVLCDWRNPAMRLESRYKDMATI
jgi:hypothetical protein